jgi:hypothetical protein
MPAKGQYKAGAKPDSVRQRKYNSSSVQKKRRADRNASRAKMVKAGRVKKGQDVDHKDKNTSNKSTSNLRARSVKANRADNRGTGGRKPKRK